MANELQVIVKQEPGVVTWNFDQLRDSLKEMMSAYKGMVYTEDSITVAKKDLATLRKLKEAVEDKRKEIRRKCLEPYNVIETQAKQLTSLIDEPIMAINGQIRDYEDARRREKKEEIMKFMSESFSDLPSEIAKRLEFKTYSPSWENATTTKKTWAEAIKSAHDQTASELKIIDEVDDDFRDMAMQSYRNNLVLAEALQKVNELQKQREMIRRREQQRREAEERRRAEEQASKEREAAAAAARAAQEAPVMEKDRQAEEAYQRLRQAAAPLPTSAPAPTTLKADVPSGSVSPEWQAEPVTVVVADNMKLAHENRNAEPNPSLQAAQARQIKQEADDAPPVEVRTLRIICTKEQFSRICGYIRFTGASFEEA